MQPVRVHDVDDVAGGVLPVEGIDENAKEHVDDADEGLRHEHALPEVKRVAHLGEEGDEEHRAGVSIDHSVDGVERGGEARGLLLVYVGWDTGEDFDGLDCFNEGGFRDGRVVGGKVNSCYHTVGWGLARM